MKNYQITEWCAHFIKEQVQEGDFCIDATMGNGNDTLLLSRPGTGRRFLYRCYYGKRKRHSAVKPSLRFFRTRFIFRHSKTGTDKYRSAPKQRTITPKLHPDPRFS